MASEKQRKAIDLQHHISDFARARVASPLKGLQKYFKPGSYMLAGGLPSPSYFPFSSITGEALVPESFALETSQPSSAFSWLYKLFGVSTSAREKTFTVTVPKYPVKPGDLSLSTALQYSPAVASPQLQKIMYDFTAKVYQPAYEDFTTLVHIGNTDGWHRAVATLCNKGEAIIVSEWTYPSALSAMMPYAVTVAPVAMDGQGMRADSLRSVLRDWDETARGSPRPHVMYTVPVGQNPSGTTMGAARKQEIYNICVEYDVVIVEDDPYFFLQEGIYIPKSRRANSNGTTTGDEESYVSSLAPSFLKFDYQGRVIRLDTFSKTIAPGSRLGWFTCNPLFAERLERQGETTTQAPCGFGTSLVTQLLMHWKHEGYIRWLRGLGTQYTLRRDHFIDCLDDEFHLQLSSARSGIWEGCDYYLASKKSSSSQTSEKVRGKTMFSFVPPTSGMFVWIKLHFDNVPSLVHADDESLEVKLWTKLAEAGVLFAPGWFFSTDILTGSHSTDGEGHLRISFSDAEFDDMKEAVKILGKVLREFFGQT